MKMGHATGTKREKAHASDWYKVHEQANIERITQAWAAFAQAEATAIDQIVSDIRQVGDQALLGYRASMERAGR